MYITIITINHTIILYLQARTRSSARPLAAGSPTLCPSVSTRTSSPAGAARAARARALSPCRYLDTNIYTVYLRNIYRWTVLVGVVAATALLSALTAGCGVVVCRRGRGRGHQPGHAPAPHWSTHVTVTPTVHHIYLVIFLSIFVYVFVRRSIGILFCAILLLVMCLLIS